MTWLRAALAFSLVTLGSSVAHGQQEEIIARVLRDRWSPKPKLAVVAGALVELVRRDRVVGGHLFDHERVIALGPGQRGIVMRLDKQSFGLRGREDVAIVKWEAQQWTEATTGAVVSLPAVELAVRVASLRTLLTPAEVAAKK